MASLLDQIKDDDFDEVAFVTVTDTEGVTAQYEFLDIVNFKNTEYAVLCEPESDGFVDIFEIQVQNDTEEYKRVTDESVLDEVFRIFAIKNEDEFDFDV